MTKFVRTLIIINGLIIPSVLFVLLISFLFGEFRNNSYQQYPVLTENLITKGGDTLMLQGLEYESPQSIYNSTNLFIKVGPKTYDVAKLKDSYSSNFERGYYNGNEYYVNIIFLDSKYNYLNTLVDEKASIKSIFLPEVNRTERIDTTFRNIGYLIAFEDSNKDKLIDSRDNYDLYISDLSGANLTQVTREKDIESFEFIKNHKEILISFTERQNIPEEHKIKRFAIYNIKSNDLKVLTDLDKVISKIQNILNK